MVIDMAVLGAIGLAGGALSAGNHMLTNRRLKKLERQNRFRNIEVSVLEFGLITAIGLQIADKVSEKRLRNEMDINHQASIDHLQSEIDHLQSGISDLNKRFDFVRMDDIMQQQADMQDKINDLVDIATMDD